MAATTDEEMELLLSSFDQIYEDFKSRCAEVESLKSDYDAQLQKIEALEFNCNSLKQENERLLKLYKQSVENLADQLDCRAKCSSLEADLKKLNEEYLSKEDEHNKVVGVLRHDFSKKNEELESNIRVLLLEKAKSEGTINNLRHDLAAHKSHMQTIAARLDRVQLDLDSKYNLEIQDLKDCLMMEQEEKNELHKKLLDLEKELLISRTELADRQRQFASSQHVENLKMKIMKLRRENEILRRQQLHSEEG